MKPQLFKAKALKASPHGRALKASATKCCPGDYPAKVPGLGRSRAGSIESNDCGNRAHRSHSRFLAQAQARLMKGNFLMCKAPEIHPGMPDHPTKLHKTHTKGRESQWAERWGKALAMRNPRAARLHPAEPTASRLSPVRHHLC